ncbi:MAG: tRNA(His) guanylyltransferase Thg1 family protein, partial [Acidobacteriota bacterium]
SHDYCVPQATRIVTRLDGRSFTRLTKEVHTFEAPFDERLRDHMTETTRHLMTCGFNILFGYTQSDEISLLFHPAEAAFGRKLRKLNSVLAGEASAKFSLLLGDQGTFDCRVVQLPDRQKIIDYFRWRSEDAHRNSLSAHCYWRLRGTGDSARQASRTLSGKSTAEKLALLAEHGIDFAELPAWQRHGIGLSWETYAKEGLNPLTGKTTVANRQRLRVDLELPRGRAFDAYLNDLLDSNDPPSEDRADGAPAD